MNTSWLTRSLFTFKVSRRLRKTVWVLLAIVVCIVVVSPGLAMLGWHAIHGNTIESRGEKVRVPFGWIADVGVDLSASLTRLPPTVFQMRDEYSYIWIGQSIPSRDETLEQQYDSWQKSYWNLAFDRAIVTGPARSGNGAREIICMQSSYLREPNRASASCLLLQGRFRADFEGSKADLDTFFAIARGVE